MRFLSALLLTPLLLTACQQNHPPAADFRLKGYEPWNAPASDPLVDTWYLTVTPEEFDRYWLVPQPRDRR